MAHRKFICIIRMKKNMWITDAGREKLQFSQEMNRAVKEEAVDQEKQNIMVEQDTAGLQFLGSVLKQPLPKRYAEYVMRNTRLDEAQAGIKITGTNITNLRYADDTTHVAESEEELKSLLMKVKKESKKVGLMLNIQKTKIMASGPITSWQIDGETVTDVILGGSKITADGDCSQEIKRCLLVGRNVMTNPHSIL